MQMIDYVKIGIFIAQMRKQQGLTQKQLAQRLNLSDKTISKWETGRSTPDNSIMLDLCEILHITVNELLSGEKISKEVYVSRAEENFVELIKEGEQWALRERQARVGASIGLLLMAGMIFLMLFGLTEGYRQMAWFLDLASFGYVVGSMVLVLLVSGTLPDFGRAFLLCYGKSENVSADMAKRALSALHTALLTLLLSGGLSFITGFILLASTQTSAKELIPSLGGAALTIFYGLLLALLLLPTVVRLKNILLGM